MSVCDFNGRQPTIGERRMMKGLVRFYERNGQIIAAKWPRKRGAPKSPAQKAWVDWFGMVARAAPLLDNCTQTMARAATRNTGWLPRDMMAAALNGTLIEREGEPKITTPTVGLGEGTSVNINAGAEGIIPLGPTLWDTNGFTTANQENTLIFKSGGLYYIQVNVLSSTPTSTIGTGTIRLELDGEKSPATDYSSLGRGFDTNVFRAVTVLYIPAGTLMRVGMHFTTFNATLRMHDLVIVGITPEQVIDD